MEEPRALLEQADIVPLALALVHLTGDEAVLEAIAPHVKGPWAHQAKLPAALAASIRERLASPRCRPAGCGA